MQDFQFESNLHALKLIHRGKVRDIYEVDERHMLIVTTDRLSAFDCVLPTPIPGKGRDLTAISGFWFERLRDLAPNHLTAIALEDVIPDMGERHELQGRSVVVRRLRALPVEAIVRGYLSGSGWHDYQRDGAICGVRLPAGLRLADALPEPIFTPSTKAEAGAHDINVDFGSIAGRIGRDTAEGIRDLSLRLYRQAAEYALDRGIIIADTKFEFGLDDSGRITLIDEALTPDSSRFWPAATYEPGANPPSFDKQFVRDYLDTLDWDHTAPGPELPAAIVNQTAEKYAEARQRLLA